MSLILDALRKSEAERQRGKSPGLFASTPGLQRESFPRMKLWPVLVFLALLLASAWVIWRGESRRAHSEVEAVAGAEPQTHSSVEVIDPFVEAPYSTTAPAPPPAVAAAAPPVSAPTIGASSASASPPPAPPKISTPPAPADTWPVLTPPAAPVESPTEESLPSVAILDSATRASLPPLKLSMHVYGQDAAKRFAIIDGKRVSEGSLLGSGVVEAIRRDGVVVNVNGQRVLVPKP